MNILKWFSKNKKPLPSTCYGEHPDPNRKLIATLVFRDGRCKYMYEEDKKEKGNN